MVGFTACLTTSCDDMLDPANDNVLNPTGINNQSQTATYVLGIIKKMQALGVRTNVLGEVRGDLVNTNSYATTDMKSIANFDFSDIESLNNNRFNQPSDYYAVINQCNYFLEFADTAKVSTITNKSIFAAEYAQVKLYRAWAYMQLGMIYGDNIPFVTEPIITQEQAVSTDMPKLSFMQILDYLIEDLSDKSFDNNSEFPEWGKSGMFEGVYANRLFFQPNIVKGDLYLWRAVLKGQGAGQDDAINAAKSYYKYLSLSSTASGNFTTPSFMETDNSEKPYKIVNSRPYVSYGTQTSENDYSEVITVLLMDTASSENNYNYLRNYYSYDEETKTPACVVPSQALDTMSRRTNYCFYAVSSTGRIDTVSSDRIAYTQEALEKHLVGDVRRAATISSSVNNDKVEEIYNQKHMNKYITYTRANEVWLKFAEALNYAGLPYYANAILSLGVNDDVVKQYIKPRSSADMASVIDEMSVYANIASTSMATTTDSTKLVAKTSLNSNAVGIHARGAGYVQLDNSYFKESPYDYDLEHKPLAPIRVDEPKRPREVQLPAVITYFPDTLTMDHCVMEEGPDGKPRRKVNNIDQNTYDKTYYVMDNAKKTYKYQNTPEDSLKFLDVYSRHNYRNSYNGARRNPKLWIQDKPLFEPVDYAELPLIAPTAGNLQESVVRIWQDSVKLNIIAAERLYELYLEQMEKYVADSIRYQQYLQDYAVYKSKLYKWESACREYYNDMNQATVDSLVLAEQALECAFEGKRYYDLLRRALWYNDPARLADPISRRNSPDNPDSDLYFKLMDRNNWFLKWSDGATGSVGKQ